MHRLILSICLGASLVLSALGAGKAEHVVIIVWDGMRPDFISSELTPTLHKLAQDGVRFASHHPVYCSSTVVNCTALATGCYPAHSGIIANSMYRPEINPDGPVGSQSTNAVRKGDALSGGHYLLRPTLVETLREAGRSTAVAGAKDIVLLQDRREHQDESCSCANLYAGAALPPSVLTAITNHLGPFPAAETNGPVIRRNEWTRRALTEVLWSTNVPAFSLLWLSEPDASQHAAGVGSPRSLAAIRDSDRQLAAVLADLDKRGLREKTDVFVVSDHGFSTIKEVVNVADVLRTNGFSACRKFESKPMPGDVLVVGQGGSVLFYVIGRDTTVIHKLVEFLQQQPFSGVVFSTIETKGTFPLDKANINCPNPPDVVLSLRWSPEKSDTGVPGVFCSDSGKVSGGHHASLSRFDMHNTLVAAGPDFRKGFTDDLPSANTDLAPTVLWLLDVKPRVAMDGRVLGEALNVDAPQPGRAVVHKLEASRQIKDVRWHQYLQTSRVGNTVYLDEGNGGVSPDKGKQGGFLPSP